MTLEETLTAISALPIKWVLINHGSFVRAECGDCPIVALARLSGFNGDSCSAVAAGNWIGLGAGERQAIVGAADADQYADPALRALLVMLTERP